MILNDSDDETDNVIWIEKPKIHEIFIFNCGCCDDCGCDDDIVCSNCCCGCKIENSSSESECDIDVIEYIINDFTIDIIEDKNKERKVRVNVNLNLNNKNIVISLDINKALYLQIADDIFNK
jgi:hypothetical protein